MTEPGCLKTLVESPISWDVRLRNLLHG